MQTDTITLRELTIRYTVKNSDQPHALDIALRRRAKQAAVLAAELRGAFIAHTALRRYPRRGSRSASIAALPVDAIASGTATGSRR